MPSPYLCERFHPTRGCVSPNFRPETIFSKVAGRVRTVDLQTRRLPLNPLLQGGLTCEIVVALNLFMDFLFPWFSLLRLPVFPSSSALCAAIVSSLFPTSHHAAGIEVS